MVRTKYVPYNKKNNQAIIMSPKKTQGKKRGVAISRTVARKVFRSEDLGECVPDSEEEAEDETEQELVDPVDVNEDAEDETETEKVIAKSPDITSMPVIKNSIVKLIIPDLMMKTNDKTSESKNDDISDAGDDDESDKEDESVAKGKRGRPATKKAAAASDSGHNSDEPSSSVSKSGRVIKKPKRFVTVAKGRGRPKRKRDGSESSATSSKRNSTRLSGKQKSLRESSFESDDDDDNVGTKTKKAEGKKSRGRGRPKKNAKPRKNTDDEDSSDVDNTYIPSSKMKRITVVGGNKGGNVEEINLAESDISDEGDASDNDAKIAGSKSAKTNGKGPRSNKTVESGSDSDEDNEPLGKRMKSGAGSSTRVSPRKSDKNSKGDEKKGTPMKNSKKSDASEDDESDYDVEEDEEEEDDSGSDYLNETKKGSKGKYKKTRRQMAKEAAAAKRRAGMMSRKSNRRMSSNKKSSSYKRSQYSTQREDSVSVSEESNSGQAAKLEEDGEYIDLKKLLLTKKIEMMDIEIHCRKLDALKKEQELKLKKSTYTLELTGGK